MTKMEKLPLFTRPSIFNFEFLVLKLEIYFSNFFRRMTLLTPPKPAEMERAAFTSFFLASLGT
jgi:hypothetical protein